MSRILAIAFAALLASAAAQSGALAHSDRHKGHDDDGHGHSMMEEMREMHKGHAHAHDFAAVKEMEPAQMQRMMKFMRDVGLVLPPMDAGHGRTLFVEKGCIVCHSVNGIGGEVGPSLNAADMPKPMNAFEFAARMWRGAQAMAAMQQEEFGDVIKLDGQELADLVAFAHDATEQKKLTADQIPQRYRGKIE